MDPAGGYPLQSPSMAMNLMGAAPPPVCPPANPGPPPGPPPGGVHPNLNASNFKTRLCTMWQQSGACIYGNTCAFAHGEQELRAAQPMPGGMRRTRMCNKWNTPGGCPYGDRCNFLHGSEVPADGGGPLAIMPARPSGGGGMGGPPGGGGGIPPPMPANYKTRMCVRFESPGGCSFGDKCHFAHGAHELRSHSRGGGGGKPMGGGGRGPYEPFAPPPPQVLFTRRDLTRPPSPLRAPPPPADSVLARVRAACQSNADAEWLAQGGSDIYGDSIKTLIGT